MYYVRYCIWLLFNLILLPFIILVFLLMSFAIEIELFCNWVTTGNYTSDFSLSNFKLLFPIKGKPIK